MPHVVDFVNVSTSGLETSPVAPALAGIVLHRAFLLGEAVTPELVGRVLDEVILPAALHGPVRPASS